MKEIRCRDSGADCNFVAQAEKEDEILKKAAEHARVDHQMESVPDELKVKMRSMIREA